MKIRIPTPVIKAYDAFGDWANVDVYWKIRRVDIILAIAGIGCVSYYWIVSGWMGALQGGVMYVLIVMMSIIIF